jgi:molybdenum cofactor cytidylyltransferase
MRIFLPGKDRPLYEKSPRIPGILLLAGRSSRMGSPKALLPFGDQPLVAVLLKRILESDLEPVVLVLGPHSRKIRQALGGLPGQAKLKIIRNPDYRQGLSTSIRKGLTQVPPWARGVMFLMGDQPLLTAPVINRIIRAFLKTADAILVPHYGRHPGNPVLFPGAMIPELMALSGDTGGRELIKKYPDRIRALPIRPQRIGRDMDTREDYQWAKEFFYEKS